MLNAGVIPAMGTIDTLSWADFERNWQVDTRHVFEWTKAALRLPLEPGSIVVAMSSGAALRGSPVSGDDPAVIVAARAGVRLAFVAALQHLPARQRAVLVLRDVLQWPAADVAQMPDMTRAGVNSALRRARATLGELDLDLDDMAEPADTTVLDRYAEAFERADVRRLAEIVRDDVVLDMPPQPRTFHGRDVRAPGNAGLTGLTLTTAATALLMVAL